MTAAAARRLQKEQKYRRKDDAEILGTFQYLTLVTSPNVHPSADQMKTWRSQAYLHFQPPVIVVEDGKTLYKFVCKR